MPADYKVDRLLAQGYLALPKPFDLSAARYVTAHANAELAMISDFGHRADGLGFVIPGDMLPEFHSGELGLFEADAPISADDFIDVASTSVVAALAQHHGVPTRLLDWTDDPWTAASFAMFPGPTGERVWALNEPVARRLRLYAWSDAYITIRILRPARAMNPFLRPSAERSLSATEEGFMRSSMVATIQRPSSSQRQPMRVWR